ncbi:PREDICTED: auxin-responsive protein IAA10 [Tarenaya hassleriana]|uniref:auxin-responsive protein IAA10 n=1 Tax=Tarenaya hassleriana TaxID=28532 RepID=UPI00053C7BFE|nr:PREDICTED: auxin-responsive protein IAA10 [Tarenaya hassleriana]
MVPALAGEDDDIALSSEDSSCPDDTETELDLALGLNFGLKGRKYFSRVHSSSSLSTCSSSSLSRESVSGAIKRTADSAALTNAAGHVVGWPPIRTYRITSLVNQAKSLGAEGLSPSIRRETSKTGITGKKDDNGSNATGASPFVKVTMDGITIGRKVDLSAHSSYEALEKTLVEMFLQPPSLTRSSAQGCEGVSRTWGTKLLDGSSGCVLTYKDKDGDWMLVGDVPWQMFVGSVKRLRIMRTSADATRASAGERTER